MRKGVLLIGNFNDYSSTEVYTNNEIYREYIRNGYRVQLLDLSGIEGRSETIKITQNIERKGGGTGLLAYWCIFIVLLKSIFNCSEFHYLTRACTRPSYSYMFLISFLGLILFKRTEFTLYSDLYTFMGPLRSKWNGYPLAGFSILMTTRTNCGCASGYNASMRFCPLKYKYRVRENPIYTKVNQLEEKPRKHLFFLCRGSKFINEILREKYENNKADIIVIGNRKYLDDFREDEALEVEYVYEDDTDQVLEYLTQAVRIYENASCNGQVIFPEQVCLTKEVRKIGSHAYLAHPMAMIKCDTYKKNVAPFVLGA